MFYEDRYQFFIFYFTLCQFLKETVTVYVKDYFSRSSLWQVFPWQKLF